MGCVDRKDTGPATSPSAAASRRRPVLGARSARGAARVEKRSIVTSGVGAFAEAEGAGAGGVGAADGVGVPAGAGSGDRANGAAWQGSSRFKKFGGRRGDRRKVGCGAAGGALASGASSHGGSSWLGRGIRSPRGSLRRCGSRSGRGGSIRGGDGSGRSLGEDPRALATSSCARGAGADACLRAAASSKRAFARHRSFIQLLVMDSSARRGPRACCARRPRSNVPG